MLSVPLPSGRRSVPFCEGATTCPAAPACGLADTLCFFGVLLAPMSCGRGRREVSREWLQVSMMLRRRGRGDITASPVRHQRSMCADSASAS